MAEWTAAYVNDLPDSAFAYIAPGGAKDSDGRTVPRSNRFMPYKDSNGTIDLPHLRNALARVAQSKLPPAAKRQAQRVLEAAAKKTTVAGDVGEYQGSGDLASSNRSLGLDVPASSLGMQMRSFDLMIHVRSDSDGRTLVGRAVPYGIVAQLGSTRERFVQGAFARQIASGPVGAVKIFESHVARLSGAPPIGKTAYLAEQPDGLHGEWPLYDTSRAEDALRLVRAGEVTGLSVGFKAVEGGSVRAPDGVIERRNVHLDHVVLTHEPVYSAATVLAVRSVPLSTFQQELERMQHVRSLAH